MQDQRLRLGTTLILSWAAYSSMVTAALILIWWLLFTRSLRALPKKGVIIAMGTMIGLSAVATQFSGGDGGSYLLRITVVLLVASWAYSERIEGEMMDLAVWLFGRKIGFDIGLLAEIAIQSLDPARPVKRPRIPARPARICRGGVALPKIQDSPIRYLPSNHCDSDRFACNRACSRCFYTFTVNHSEAFITTSRP